MSQYADINWAAIRCAAGEAARNGYAPYSGYRVGAAALTDRGTLLTGCNVENASYGLTLCAECAIVSRLHAERAGRIVALACRTDTGTVITPCGRCRQLILEHAAPGALVDAPDGPVPVEDLLPFAFGPANLESDVDVERA